MTVWNGTRTRTNRRTDERTDERTNERTVVVYRYTGAYISYQYVYLYPVTIPVTVKSKSQNHSRDENARDPERASESRDPRRAGRERRRRRRSSLQPRDRARRRPGARPTPRTERRRARRRERRRPYPPERARQGDGRERRRRWTRRRFEPTLRSRVWWRVRAWRWRVRVWRWRTRRRQRRDLGRFSRDSLRSRAIARVERRGAFRPRRRGGHRADDAECDRSADILSPRRIARNARGRDASAPLIARADSAPRLLHDAAASAPPVPPPPPPPPPVSLAAASPVRPGPPRGATFAPAPTCDPTVMAVLARASASALRSRSTCDARKEEGKLASMMSRAVRQRGTRCSFFTFHAPLTWFTTRDESPLTSRWQMPRSAALESPRRSARYSASLFVLSSPRYSASSKMTRSSASRRMSAPAPDGPGLPRHAPSKNSV